MKVEVGTRHFRVDLLSPGLEVATEPRAVSGRLKTRAFAPERTLARVCREAWATVRYNAKLRDMDFVVSANADRAMEALVSDGQRSQEWPG